MVNKRSISAILATLGAVLLIVGTWLPLWSKDDVSVNGWEGDYFAFGRWLMLAAAILAVAAWAVQSLRKPRWMALAGLMAVGQAGLVLWQGHKLQAIGVGAWLLLLGAVLVLMAGAWSFWTDSRLQKS